MPYLSIAQGIAPPAIEKALLSAMAVASVCVP